MMKEINFDVNMQGIIKVESAVIYKKRKDICLLYVDLNERAHIIATGSEPVESKPGISVPTIAFEICTHHTDKEDDGNDLTEIVFSDFEGWDIFSCSMGKTTAAIALERLPKPSKKNKYHW